MPKSSKMGSSGVPRVDLASVGVDLLRFSTSVPANRSTLALFQLADQTDSKFAISNWYYTTSGTSHRVQVLASVFKREELTGTDSQPDDVFISCEYSVVESKQSASTMEKTFVARAYELVRDESYFLCEARLMFKEESSAGAFMPSLNQALQRATPIGRRMILTGVEASSIDPPGTRMRLRTDEDSTDIHLDIWFWERELSRRNPIGQLVRSARDLALSMAGPFSLTL